MNYTPGSPTGLHRSLMRNVWSQQVDKLMGEYLFVQPMRRPNPNAQSEPDQTRKGFQVAGIFRAPLEPTELSQADSSKLNVALSRPQISVALASLPYGLRIGDVFVRLARAEYYEIKAARADALRVRGEFELFQLGNQPGLGGSFYDRC